MLRVLAGQYHGRDDACPGGGTVAREHGLEIEFIKKKSFRKEDRIKRIVAERGESPGLVHIFSAMESCTAFKPWHNKTTGKTYLKPSPGKCLHYYFYFILPGLGLGYLRVPMWAPFRLQFYFNGHRNSPASSTKRASMCTGLMHLPMAPIIQ